MGKGYILVEGHGETEAVGNLISRLSKEVGFPRAWAPPIRWKNLHLSRGLLQGANFIRTKPDAEALLILRDEDDQCPKEMAPGLADCVRGLRLPFPCALVLFHPEYEVLFLPCLDRMAGKTLGSGASARPGLRHDTRWEASSWESKRGIKEWLSGHFPANRSYKPTTDQLELTRFLDFGVLRGAELPCFGTLERALGFLARATAGGVYPYPKTE